MKRRGKGDWETKNKTFYLASYLCYRDFIPVEENNTTEGKKKRNMYLHSGPTPRGREDPSFEAAASAVIEQIDTTPNNTSHWVLEFTMMAAST